jgi:glycosyltransferase involved in cell wall biosynthesis
MARELLRWGLPSRRIVAVPNFTALRTDASTEPGAYGLYVGRLAAEKGLDVLLHALQASGDPPFRIVGTGPLEKSLRALSARLHLRNTEFVGYLDRPGVDEALRDARFVTLPSRCTENAPLAALEAMAAGRPLLVSDLGGLPELVAGGAGVLCRAGDSRDLANHMENLMRDDRRCRKAGQNALRYAMENFNPEVHRERVEAVYERAVLLGVPAATRTARGWQ